MYVTTTRQRYYQHVYVSTTGYWRYQQLAKNMECTLPSTKRNFLAVFLARLLEFPMLLYWCSYLLLTLLPNMKGLHCVDFK